MYIGRAAEAMESLEMAVAIDPEFAMAYHCSGHVLPLPSRL